MIKTSNLTRRSSSHNTPGKWLHSNDSLVKCSVVYSVKFLGHVEVDLPKGSEVVKEAIRKMKFNKQVKRAEGQKCARVELYISIRNISIMDPKTKAVMFQYPLHLVSYCADDKSDRRIFSFIAKDKASDKHHCFVFDSERSAMDITMSLGQAFELAYQHFLDTTSRKGDLKNQLVSCHKKIRELTEENLTLKQRVALLEKVVETAQLPSSYGAAFTAAVANHAPAAAASTNHAPAAAALTNHTPPLSKGQSYHSAASTNGGELGRSQQNSLIDDENLMNGNHVTVNHTAITPPILSPPPPIPSRSHSNHSGGGSGFNHTTTHSNGGEILDLFGAPPFSPTSPPVQSSNPFSPAPPLSPLSGAGSPLAAQTYPYYAPVTPSSDTALDDPFGLGAFGTSASTYSERDFLDMQINLSRGLTFDTDDFSLDDLDPLKK